MNSGISMHFYTNINSLTPYIQIENYSVICLELSFSYINIDINDRIYPFCNTVEIESNVILHCRLYNNIRMPLLRQM